MMGVATRSTVAPAIFPHLDESSMSQPFHTVWGYNAQLLQFLILCISKCSDLHNRHWIFPPVLLLTFDPFPSALFLQLAGDDVLWQWWSQPSQCVQLVKPLLPSLLALWSIQPSPAGRGCPFSGWGLPLRRHPQLVHARGESSLFPHHAYAQPQQAQPHFTSGTCWITWCWWCRSQVRVHEWQWLNGQDYDWGWWHHHWVSTTDRHQTCNWKLAA